MSRVVDTYPLSPLQEGMLFNALYAPHSGVDVEQILCRTREGLDRACFERAWNHAAARHDILRTSFRWEGLDTPVQDVHDNVAVPFMYEEWPPMADDAKQERLERFLAADRDRGYDLGKPPAIRVALFHAADGEDIVVWSMHHIVIDGVSVVLLLREVFDAYAAYMKGRAPELEPRGQYREFIRWIKTQDLSKAEAYWREILRGFESPTVISIGLDADGVSRSGAAPGRIESALRAEVRAGIVRLAAENGVTIYNVVQAAWSVLLSRYSGQEDVVFATIRGSRGSSIANAENIVGMFINTLPVRAKPVYAKPIGAFLKELRAQHQVAREFLYAPIVEIQRWSDLAPGLPLFDTLLDYQKSPWYSVLHDLGDTWKQRQFSVRHKTNFSLSVDVVEEPELSFAIDYNRRRFGESSVARMVEHLRNILEGMAVRPEGRIGELPMLGEEERRRIVVDWNATEAAYPRGETIHGLFERRAAATPDAPAVVLGERSISYREIDERSNRLARRLRALGVGVDAPVAVCLDRTPDLVVALLAAMKAGGVYVPLDPAYPRDRLAFMLEDTASPVLLTEEKLLDLLPERRAHTIRLDTGWSEVAGESAEPLGGTAGPDKLAYIIYTSGSTGKPKGVCCRHASVLNLFADFDRRAPLAPGDRCGLWTSVSFDVSVYEIFSALLAGGTLYIASDAIRYDSGAFIPWLAEHRIASAYVPPLMLGDLDEWIRAHPGRLALRRLLVGVEPINETLLASIMTGVPGLAIINGYGPTETTICSTLHTVRRETARDRVTPIGRPVQNSWIYLLDAAMRPVPVGIAGEIFIGGEGLARGYLNRPELTAERFVPDPLSGRSGSRLYRTGDRARFLGDGEIEFVGRTDFQVKVRGFRVEPGEIETVLEQHPAVKEAVVLAKADRTGTKRLVAYAVTVDSAKTSASDLRTFLKEKLPDYMVPTSFVLMDAFPLTPNGKLDRAALPEPEASRDESRAYIAPRNETEMRLAQLWERVMGIERIGVTDNFFDLGGHSLLAVRLFSEITRVFGSSIPLAAIFQSPTIAELAPLVAGEGASTDGRALVPIQPRGTKPPLFFVHAYGGGVFFYRELSDHLGPDQPFYGLQSVGLDGKRMPHRRVEDMAAHYIGEMRAAQPKGPYHIGGRCLGAYVAFEMANQLRAAGEEVALLAVLDSYWTPQRERPRAERAGGKVRAPLRIGLREKIAYVRQHIIWRFQKDGIWITERLSPLWFRLGGRIPRRLMHFYLDVYIPEINGRAEKRYLPRIYPGLITFFQATAERDRDPREFWGKLTSEGIEMIMVPASHRDILVEPNVQVLAEKMREVIARARGETR